MKSGAFWNKENAILRLNKTKVREKFPVQFETEMEVLNHSLWLMLGYQSVGFSLYGFHQFFQEKGVPKLLFGLFMLAFGMASFLIHIHLFQHSATLFILFPLVFCFGLALVPLFYLHHKSLLIKDFKLRFIDFKHFVLFFVMLLLLMPFWLLLSINHPEYLDAVYGVFLLKSMPGRQTWLIEIIIKSVIGIQLLIYLGYGIKLYKNFYREKSEAICGELKLYINGIQTFAISFVILMLLLISHRFIHETGDSVSSTLFIFALLILNIGLAYFGIRFDNNELYDCDLTLPLQPQETKNIVIKESAIKAVVPEKKYQSSCLCNDLKEELIASLLYVMKEHEPYTNSRIRIDDVAELVGTNTKYLSQLINEHFGKNFHVFLNDYRCTKVVKLFHDQNFDEYSIEGIAETCGFNSRSTFVASFKKFSGKLPSEYRNSIHVRSKR